MDELPEGRGEKVIAKLERQQMFGRGLELILVVFVLGLTAYGQYQIQNVIKTNQQSTVEARKANVQRQDALKNYVKCLSLGRFDHPELLLPTATRQQVSDALDNCAKVQ